MGTHPIFESDFDCLTDKKCQNQSRTENISSSITMFGTTVLLGGKRQTPSCHLDHVAQIQGWKNWVNQLSNKNAAKSIVIMKKHVKYLKMSEKVKLFKNFGNDIALNR